MDIYFLTEVSTIQNIAFQGEIIGKDAKHGKISGESLINLGIYEKVGAKQI